MLFKSKGKLMALISNRVGIHNTGDKAYYTGYGTPDTGHRSQDTGTEKGRGIEASPRGRGEGLREGKEMRAIHAAP